MQWVRQPEIAKANAAPQVAGNPTEALLALAITKLSAQGEPDPYSPCYVPMQAFTNAYIATVQANATIINRAIGAAAVPASILASGWANSEMLQGAGAVAIDAVNSDVNFDSGNVATGSDSSAVAGRSGQDNPNVNTPDSSSVDIDKSTDENSDSSTNDSNNTTNPEPPDDEVEA